MIVNVVKYDGYLTTQDRAVARMERHPEFPGTWMAVPFLLPGEELHYVFGSEIAVIVQTKPVGE